MNEALARRTNHQTGCNRAYLAVCMQTAESEGGYEGVPSGIVDDEMKNKHGILRSLELLIYTLNKTTVIIVMPQSIYGVVPITSYK